MKAPLMKSGSSSLDLKTTLDQNPRLFLFAKFCLLFRRLICRPPLRAAVPAITERRPPQRFLPQETEKDPPILVFWFVLSWLFCVFPWDLGGQKRLPGLKVPRRRSFCIVPRSFQPGLCPGSRRPLCLSCFFLSI